MDEQVSPAALPNVELDSLDWAVLESKYSVTVREKLTTLPNAPGCYLMKNADGQIIYIGKAKILKNRVRQYFQKGADHTRRIRRMISEISDLDWIITDTELEALILESNLIKKHHPNYNVRLRDDKSYPYIAVTLSEEWPRVAFMRKLRMSPKETDKYFGPYTDSEAVRETLRLIRRVFRIPCGYRHPEQSKGKACMYYHINQCTGVCAGKISKEDYMAVIEDVMQFLSGRNEQLVDRLLQQMEEAAENLEFERAARLRDQVQAIQTLVARQKVVTKALEDQDVIALVTDNGNTCAEMFFIRGGKLIGQEHFMLENASTDDLSDSLTEFIKQYYDTAPYVPREVLLNADIDEMDIIESWLKQKRGTRVTIHSPKRGERKQLVDMAKKNADLVLKQIKLKMATDENRVAEELGTLQQAIGSPTLPRRIEAYDISNIQGHFTVASLVVFENGQPKKAHYRKFKIKRPDGQPDDYASMKEVLTRRLTGSLRHSEAFRELPDMILIDGGKGQLNAALEVITAVKSQALQSEDGDLGDTFEKTAIIGLAKQNEEIYKPGRMDPIILPRHSRGLYVIQRIRDEAHRFAITYHRNLRGKTMRASTLNQIPGIGAARRKALIKHFGTIEKIRNASIEELAAAPTMHRAAAEAVHGFFAQANAEE
ncbi:MAG: excinuclease ABC subunit UvrC [Armatimonadota bacterium]|nr:excinuclease ABC subunit UvrC [bacterium]